MRADEHGTVVAPAPTPPSTVSAVCMYDEEFSHLQLLHYGPTELFNLRCHGPSTTLSQSCAYLQKKHDESLKRSIELWGRAFATNERRRSCAHVHTNSAIQRFLTACVEKLFKNKCVLSYKYESDLTSVQGSGMTQNSGAKEEDLGVCQRRHPHE